MRTTPGSYLSQQYNTIKAMFEDKLIIESIEPNFEDDYFTYMNQVVIGSERSPISAKYFNSCRQYLAIFKCRSFHYLLNDASIARFHYEFDENYKLVSYNLLWFPCPFSSDFLSQFRDEEGNIEKFTFFEYLDEIEEVDTFNYTNFSFRTPVRIDYDLNYSGTKSSFHPTSHIHFQNTDTRAKSNDIFCLYRFFAFIIENCYPNLNYTFNLDDDNISIDMINESNHWLKCKKTKGAQFGEEIRTSFSF